MKLKKNSDNTQETIDISKIREVTTIVGPGTEVTGNLCAETTLRIDGILTVKLTLPTPS
jgi:cytoskeletal protein CcmA (bactofilin family)